MVMTVLAGALNIHKQHAKIKLGCFGFLGGEGNKAKGICNVYSMKGKKKFST